MFSLIIARKLFDAPVTCWLMKFRLVVICILHTSIVSSLQPPILATNTSTIWDHGLLYCDEILGEYMVVHHCFSAIAMLPTDHGGQDEYVFSRSIADMRHRLPKTRGFRTCEAEVRMLAVARQDMSAWLMLKEQARELVEHCSHGDFVIGGYRTTGAGLKIRITIKHTTHELTQSINESLIENNHQQETSGPGSVANDELQRF